MKQKLITSWAWIVPLAVALDGWGQENVQSNQVQQLQRQLLHLQQAFEQMQLQHRQQIETMQRQIEALQRQAVAVVIPSTSAVPATASTQSPSAPPTVPAPAVESSGTWSPVAPITLVGNQRSYLNLSFDGLFAAGGSTAQDVGLLEPGGHDPKVNGFTAQSLETVFDGAVDPFFRARANFLAQIDSEGASSFEVEEAFAQTTSLPGNLQVKAGQYLTEFGRINASHPHTWAFVDTPLVISRLLGPEGLRNPGAQVSWLMPLSFYSELFLSVQNSAGETAWSFRNPDQAALLQNGETANRGVSSAADMLYVPRYAVSFDVTDTHTVLLGGSGAFGPNSAGDDTYTQIYGMDLTWKWRARDHHGGFPFVAWQSEFLWRDFEAGGPGTTLSAETIRDYGFYSQLTWGFLKGWVAGFRGDWVSGNQGLSEPAADVGHRWRLSPNVTWYPTEFSRLRLQYNYDQRDYFGTDHSVWLQLEFILGAHAAHKF